VNDIREDRRPGQCEQVERGEGAHVIVLGVDLGPSHEKQIDHRNVALPGRIVEGGATILVNSIYLCVPREERSNGGGVAMLCRPVQGRATILHQVWGAKERWVG